jgi:hypothetical protein
MNGQSVDMDVNGKNGHSCLHDCTIVVAHGSTVPCSSFPD